MMPARLQLITASGTLALGDAPETDLSCTFCGAPAQVIADTPKRTMTACAGCVVDALIVAVEMTGPAARTGGGAVMGEHPQAGQSNAQDIGPSGLPFGCHCDPYDCGPAAHDHDCVARIPEFDWMNRHRPSLALLDELLAEVARQDSNYGMFEPDVAGMRLAAAALEDESEEVKRAWRDERKVDGWNATVAEALQAASVALRLVRDGRSRVV